MQNYSEGKELKLITIFRIVLSGITNFDLIGNFGSMEWLGNFYIIFTYNAIFTGATVLCLVTKVTDTVRREIFMRIISAFQREKPRSYSLNGDVRSD